MTFVASEIFKKIRLGTFENCIVKTGKIYTIIIYDMFCPCNENK